MVRIPLLLLLLGGLVGAEVAPDAPAVEAAPAAAEAAAAATAAVEPAPPPADDAPAAEPAPVFETVTIANRHARLTVTTNCGAVTRFELIGVKPVELPPALKSRVDEKVQDPDADLAILGDFLGNPAIPRGELHNKLDFSTESQVTLDGTRSQAWTIKERSATSVTIEFRPSDRPIAVEMTYTMEEDRPSVRVDLRLSNPGAEAKSYIPRIDPVFRGIVQDYPPYETYYVCGFEHNEGIIKIDIPAKVGMREIKSLGEGDYWGLKSRFFATIFEPLDSNATISANTDETKMPSITQEESMDGAMPRPKGSAVFWSNATGNGTLPIPVLSVEYASVKIEPGGKADFSWRITGTSMKKTDLALLTEAEQRVQYTDWFYRFFKSLANLLAIILDAIAIVVRNYGVALIVLTFLIKLALHRFTFKQQASMLKMSKLAPEIKLLQERYKNDRQQLGLKTMEMYKKHGVNPLSGCLPMFIQMPMFMALYQVFTHSADFRGAGFLWIKDLTLEDAIWGIDHPWLHWLTINPLALIYIGVTLWMSFQTKIPEGADPQQAQMQKMMRWLPLIFGVIFYHMPAGLVLYFTVNAILSTIEIKMVKKKLGMP